MERIPMTAGGHEALVEQIRHLKSTERPRIIRAIEEARAHGDLSENAEYHAAKEAQGLNESKVLDLEDKLSRAEIIDVSTLSGKIVTFGATVVVLDEETEKKRTLQIVGEIEADASKGKIAIVAPLARALIGKKAGDSVEVSTPGGDKYYEVVKVKFV